MHHIFDADTRAAALNSDLAPDLRALLTASFAELDAALAHQTEWLVIQPGDTEAEISEAIGCTPLVEPIDGVRYPDFQQGAWDSIIRRGRYWRIAYSFGSSFGLLLLVEDVDGVIPDLRALCRRFVDEQ
jgi:hypothetical protein